MAVDLSDLISDLQSEVSAPGLNNFPNATDDDYVSHLRNGFWEAKLDGLVAPWTEANGLITPVTPTGADMTRDLQQLVIFYAGFRILRGVFRNYVASTRAKAGPVEFQTAGSATVIRDLLKEMQEKRMILLRRLSDLGQVPTAYIDGVQARTNSIVDGDVWYAAGRVWTNQYPYGKF